MFPLLLVPLALLLSIRVTSNLALMLPLHLLTFVAAALLCHTRLADDRPAPAHLTEFYLWTSFGGMLGGLFNGLAAPLLFTRVFEYPLVLAAACAILPGAIAMSVSRRAFALDFAVPIAIGVADDRRMRGLSRSKCRCSTSPRRSPPLSHSARAAGRCASP